jgi:hypothetical protein
MTTGPMSCTKASRMEMQHAIAGQSASVVELGSAPRVV